MFLWFERPEPYRAHARALQPFQVLSERHVASKETFEGLCIPCGDVQLFKVAAGPTYASNPNLREGLVCPRGLSNRNRLLAAACLEMSPGRPAILERFSPLYASLQQRFPELQGSEFLGPDVPPGASRVVNGTRVRHESIVRLSYPDGSLDLLVHSDVLEHVPEPSRALSEAARVLAPGGTMLMTVPFFASRDENFRRAILRDDGVVEHLAEPEIHGDPLNPQGALAYHHFGWQLLDQLREAGFRRAEVGLWYDVFCGFVSDNHPDLTYGNMLPIVIRASKEPRGQ